MARRVSEYEEEKNEKLFSCKRRIAVQWHVFEDSTASADVMKEHFSILVEEIMQ
jgi:hypothetical protein